LVICTRNRAAQLDRCLTALKELHSPEKWELIVINNASSDNTMDIIESFQGSLPCELRVAVEPKPGLGRARNLGWRTACGDLVAFTDDDCYPDPHFLSAVLLAFKDNPRLGFVGGQIRLYDPTDYRITIQEHAQRESLPPRSFIPAGLIQGANMSFRRSAIGAVGGFDEMFGAGAVFPCEDIDIVARLSATGWEGAYDPAPLVYHHHGRKTDAQAARLMKQYDRGRGAYYAKSLLNRSLRTAALKHWYRSILSQPYRTTGRELAAACEYWARLAVATGRSLRWIG
jgi:GT2 family glycosyltransferase